LLRRVSELRGFCAAKEKPPGCGGFESSRESEQGGSGFFEVQQRCRFLQIGLGCEVTAERDEQDCCERDGRRCEQEVHGEELLLLKMARQLSVLLRSCLEILQGVCQRRRGLHSFCKRLHSWSFVAGGAIAGVGLGQIGVTRRRLWKGYSLEEWKSISLGGVVNLGACLGRAAMRRR
jgi:hypothetical protein